ncbi:unnamed protein product (macronuclear) [Paramecium tetraurelia]|uniref:Uncharacterized protein n=1 Tax=Paramecium tetraurelia TaxID=5888 RepID=A0BML6_PARTE|nr:uncharacterized protein GSPATT00030419001 [Paramecium tetraurelia]CAK59783.1 unnamed protein product [Paramecium tetraurelia]|eukprot:XP_001427181.1 hypothetical protein (macronuclear) [Paramecium tetraurelia strain d4-2]
MADLDCNNINFIDDQKSTENQVKISGILKKSIQKERGCLCQKLRQKKKYKIQSPEESSNECDGWEQEDIYDRKSAKNSKQKEIVDLVQYASKLEFMINVARQQLRELEETMQPNHAQN